MKRRISMTVGPQTREEFLRWIIEWADPSHRADIDPDYSEISLRHRQGYAVAQWVVHCYLAQVGLMDPPIEPMDIH